MTMLRWVLLAGSNHVAVAANREFTVIPCEIGGSERGMVALLSSLKAMTARLSRSLAFCA